MSDADAHIERALALHGQGKLAEAVAEYRAAIGLRPDYAEIHNKLGYALRQQGKPDEAIAEFRKAIRLQPDFAHAHYNLGLAFMDQGKPEEAVAELREAIRITPESAEAHLNLANNLINQGKLDDAIAEFREAIRLQPRDALAHFTLAFELLAARRGRRDDEEALVLARRAVQLEPTREIFAMYLALAQYRTEHWAEFLAAARRGVVPVGTASTIGFMLAVAHWHKGNKREARSWFNNAVESMRQNPVENPEAEAEVRRLWTEAAELLGQPGPAGPGRASPATPGGKRGDTTLTSALATIGRFLWGGRWFGTRQGQPPADFDALFRTAVVLAEKGKLDQATATLREAIRIHPADADAYYNLGVLLQHQGKLDEAITAYRDAIRIKPDLADVHTNLGVALREQGKLDEATATLREAIRIHPDDANAHNHLGIVLNRQGTLGEAIAEMRAAIRLKPDDADAHYNLGIALKAQGMLDEAIGNYRNALRIQPDLADVHYNLGLALSEQGKLEEAIATFREGLRIQPDAAAHTNLGIALLQEGKPDQAIAEFREAIRISPELVEPRLNLGSTLQALGKCDEAIAEFRAAIRVRPGDERAHLALGNALREQGRHEEAVTAFYSSFGQLPSDPDEPGEGLEPPAWTKSDPGAAAEAYYSRGSGHLAQARPAQAVRAFRKTIDFQPNHAAAHSDLAWCLAPFSDPSGPDYSEALVHARKGVELAPQNANSHRALALAEYGVGHWTESLAAAERSMALKRGGNARDWFILALARWQTGEKDQARIWFEKAAAWTNEKSPKDPELRRLWSEAAQLLALPGPSAGG
ncbi:MAG: tetratricopeptide repeat protein [Isosphaeraceae bacterium]